MWLGRYGGAVLKYRIAFSRSRLEEMLRRVSMVLSPTMGFMTRGYPIREANLRASPVPRPTVNVAPFGTGML